MDSEVKNIFLSSPEFSEMFVAVVLEQRHKSLSYQLLQSPVQKTQETLALIIAHVLPCSNFKITLL